MTTTAYLAGPDVFLPDALAHAARKVEICARHGLRALAPLNQDIETSAKAPEVWQTIYYKDIAMMERCDFVIANLTPFGGASADAGTLIEIGWFLGKGKPIFGYSNTSESFESRMRRQHGEGFTDLGIEGFHLPDNLMIVGAVQSGGCPIFVPGDDTARGVDALDVFEVCVAAAARSVCARGGRATPTS
ncbi:nucleoside 2-deoxyribosyltransferase [soil metagenome]